jgi:hypothetical protein
MNVLAGDRLTTIDPDCTRRRRYVPASTPCTYTITPSSHVASWMTKGDMDALEAISSCATADAFRIMLTVSPATASRAPARRHHARSTYGHERVHAVSQAPGYWNQSWHIFFIGSANTWMHGMHACMHARGTQHAAPGIDNGARRLRSHVLHAGNSIQAASQART